MQAAKIEFYRARNFGDVLSDAFEFIRQNFKILLKGVFILAAPFYVAGGFLMGMYQQDALQVTNPAAVLNMMMSGMLPALGLNMIGATMLLGVSTEITVLYNERGAGGFGMDELWKAVRKDFFMLFLTMLGIMVFLTMGTILFIIPGIYLSIALAIMPVVRVVERAGFFKSLGRSTSLMSGFWWRSFGLIIVLLLIISIMGILFVIPQQIVYFLFTFHKADPSIGSGVPSFLIPLTTVFASLSNLFYAVPFIAMVFHYYSLVEKKEAAGLFRKVESIEQPK